MIFGHHFTLPIDHKPLLSIFGSKKGIPMYSANRLQRWTITLLGYNFLNKIPPNNRIWSGWCIVMSHQITFCPRWWHHHSDHQYWGWFPTHTYWLCQEFLWRKLKLSKRCSKTKCFKMLSSFSDVHSHLTSLESCNNISGQRTLWPSLMSVLCLQTGLWSLQNSGELFSNNYTQNILASIGWKP